MSRFFRGILAFVSAIATFYFFGWMAAALLSALLPSGVGFVIAFLGSATLAVVIARRVWRWSAAPESDGGVLVPMVMGAAIVGGLAFVLGFFGPLVFAPDANQGPLLGLFVTGPLGVVAGAVGGCIYGIRQKRPR